MENVSQLRMQSQAYESIFTIENILRSGMHSYMACKNGLDYFNDNTFPEYALPDGRLFNVVQAAKTRKGHEQSSGISLRYTFHLLWYLDFSALVSMLDHFWPLYFHNLFKKNTDKDKLIGQLKFLTPIRNALAHNRYIGSIDRSIVASYVYELKLVIQSDNLSDYQSLSFSTTELQVLELTNSLSELISEINRYRVINIAKIEAMQPLASYLSSSLDNPNIVVEMTTLTSLIALYNKLPRKPGQHEPIDKFIINNKLIEKTKLLIGTLGAYI